MNEITQKLEKMEVEGNNEVDLAEKMEKMKIDIHPVYKIPIRGKCYKLFYKKFVEYIPDKHNIKFDQPVKIAKNIEKSCYNTAIKTTKNANWENPNFKSQYSTIARKVSANISYTPNASYVLKQLKEKKWKFTDLAKMTHEELDSPERKEYKLKLQKQFLMSRKGGGGDEKEEERGDGMFQCGKCKSKKTEHTQKQTRSADEPMTVFIYCHGCGARWKQ